MLEARDLWFRYRRDVDWVVAGFDLRVAPGEVVGLRGPSGRGKTTVARLLAGYLQPERGDVLVGGAPLPPPISGRPQPVQLVAQHPELAVDPRWRLERILAEVRTPDPSLLAALSIVPEWLDRFPNELSGGELQRVTVARALLTDPPYLIADEITAMLDPLTQAQIWHVLVDRVHHAGLGLLVVSHDDQLLHAATDRVVDLEVGQSSRRAGSSRWSNSRLG